MNYDLNTLRGDFFGGLTSMVVALPVALAFGVASGMGAPAGLYGAIAVGFFASVFGGTRSQVSGPTGPMTVAMAVIIARYAGNLTEALMVVVLAGLLQVLLGLSRVGRFVAYTPYVVVSGFMSGIGIIIMLIQALPFLGSPPRRAAPWERLPHCRRRQAISASAPSPSPPSLLPLECSGLTGWQDSCPHRLWRWLPALCWACCG